MRETHGSALNRVIIYYLETSTHLLIFFFPGRLDSSYKVYQFYKEKGEYILHVCL